MAVQFVSLPSDDRMNVYIHVQEHLRTYVRTLLAMFLDVKGIRCVSMCSLRHTLCLCTTYMYIQCFYRSLSYILSISNLIIPYTFLFSFNTVSLSRSI